MEDGQQEQAANQAGIAGSQRRRNHAGQSVAEAREIDGAPITKPDTTSQTAAEAKPEKTRSDLARLRCRVLSLTPLRRELILRLCDSELSAPFDPKVRRLCDVALDEIATLSEAPLCSPGGRAAGVLRLARYLGLHPEDGRPFADLAQMVGASPRNMERLFRRETGLSPRQWRARARLLSAIERLNEGPNSTRIAHALGYSGPSAFVSAFRRQFCQLPKRFLTVR